MRQPKSRHSILALCGMLVVLCLTACGTSAPHAKVAWGNAVVRVGRYTITKPMLDHWTAVESVLTYTYKPTQPVPKGVVSGPPDYTSCVARAAKTQPHGAHADTAALRAQCAIQYKAIQQHILEILITNDWMHEEARTQGVQVSLAEVNHMVSNEFSSRAHFERFLRLTGEREADEQFIVESELLVIKLHKKVSSKPGLSEEQRWRLAGNFAGEVIARWRPRTSCRPGYVISVCRGYKRPIAQP